MGLFGPPDVAKLKAKGDVKGLIKALGYQKDWHVRQAAAEALGKIGDARAVEPLVAALKDQDSNARQGAAEALGRIGDARAVEPLIAALKEGAGVGRVAALNSNARQAAAGALGQIGDARAVEPLIAALRDQDQYTGLRKAAVGALGRIGDARAVEPLIAVLRDPGEEMCKAAAEALGQIGAPAVEPLIAVLEPGTAVEHAKRALGQIGAPAVEPLIAVLGVGGLRTAAVDALGRIGDARAVEPLIAALKDKDWFGRSAAAEALGKIGDARAKDKDWYGRKAAAEALGKIGDARAVEPLVAALVDPALRREAAVALGQIGDARAIEPLIPALLDQDDYMRRAAVEALHRLSWSPDRGETGAAYWVARGEWDKCVQIGAPAVEPLIAALTRNEEGWRVRSAAAKGLVGIYRSGRLEEAQKVKLLTQREVITRSHNDGFDRCSQSHVDVGIGVDFPL